jgi:hypothetical protein
VEANIGSAVELRSRLEVEGPDLGAALGVLRLAVARSVATGGDSERSAGQHDRESGTGPGVSEENTATVDGMLRA